MSMRAALSVLVAALAGCTGVPEGVKPVRGFEPERYLGRWHEIARLDHSFERGLSDVTASYARRSDGGIDVINRGFDAAKNEWREATGRACFLGQRNVVCCKPGVDAKVAEQKAPQVLVGLLGIDDPVVPAVAAECERAGRAVNDGVPDQHQAVAQIERLAGRRPSHAAGAGVLQVAARHQTADRMRDQTDLERF